MPIDKVHISETSSDKVPNASPTAASVSSDLYGMAVKNCCDQIMERLKPFCEKDPTAGWGKWVSKQCTDIIMSPKYINFTESIILLYTFLLVHMHVW